MLKSTDLDHLEKMASAATRGPWTHRSNEDQLGEYVCTITRGDGEISDFSVGTRGDWGQMVSPELNARFISAASPTVILALINEVRALRAIASPSGEIDAVLSRLRKAGMSVDGDNLYKRDLCDCIAGALAFGKQGRNLPPEGHWLRRFWDLGRAEEERQEDLVIELRLAAETLRRYETLHRAKNTEESTAKAEVNASLAERFESVIAAATA